MFSKLFKFDWLLIMAVVLLMALGLVALYSISATEPNFSQSVFSRQLMFAFLGIIILAAGALLDYRYFKNYSTPLYFFTLAILIFVLVVGKTIRGTSGWIGIGTFHIQPAEIAKLMLVVFMAGFISKKSTELGALVRLIASFVFAGITIVLVLRQPDFGSAMILVSIWLGMTLLAGVSRTHLAALAMSGVILVIIGWTFLAPYQKARIYNFFDPYSDPQKSGYNAIQSTVAVGSGGMFGKGIGNGSQSQLNFLPEKHTDFIFAMIAEELGFLGSLFVLALYGVLLYRIYIIARYARNNFAFLLISGIFIMNAAQVVINIGMNIGILPVTGIPLPFVSYGGSSLVTMCLAVGIVLNVGLEEKSSLNLNGFMEPDLWRESVS